MSNVRPEWDATVDQANAVQTAAHEQSPGPGNLLHSARPNHSVSRNMNVLTPGHAAHMSLICPLLSEFRSGSLRATLARNFEIARATLNRNWVATGAPPAFAGEAAA